MPDINAGKCTICEKEKAETLGLCIKCWNLALLSENKHLLGINADKVIKAINEDIISKEVYIIKRDRLLHLQKIANDKYLTKLKAEVEKI